MSTRTPSRRELLAAVKAAVAPQPRLVPRVDLVNTLEYEDQARLVLSAPVFRLASGGDRSPFDRITLRPRMMTPVLDMDLGVTLFGDSHFTPIIVGPIDDQRRFHADAELATVKGASAGKAAMVVSSRSSVPIDQLAAQAKTPLWFQVFANDPAARAQVQKAVTAGCKAICVTIGAAPLTTGARPAAALANVNWTAVSALKKETRVPMVVKGVMTPEAAQLALSHGADGLVVSNYGGVAGAGATILTLPKILDAVGGKVPVLVDGAFRRGTDILKALAFGAQGVLIGRPIVWGLAAYGADGVQGVIEMLQTELARYMGMCGKSNLKMLDRTVVKVHAT